MILGGTFLTSKLLKDGDMIEIISAGDWVESTKFKNPDGEWVKQAIFDVKYKGEDYSFRMNSTNRNNLKLAWGRDTSKWIGKKAQVSYQKALIAGQMKEVIYLTPQVENW